ncbi:MAG: F0F1 ATP synthase subunit epsilon, partial [Pseudobdellovibrio sp.]
TVFKAVISSGYCEVSPEGVNILTESITLKEETTEEAAKSEVKNTETKLAKEVLTDEEFEATLVEAEKARAKVQLLN